ncbi:MAG: formate dehydrogenase accessory sulfurtransferase FdhD [Nitrososphaerota archaeon]
MSFNNSVYSSKRIIKFSLEHGPKEFYDIVVKEEPINIFINNEHYVTLLSTPCMIKELVVGHLLSEGIINSFKEINEINIIKNNVMVHIPKEKNIKLELSKKIKLIISACGDLENFYKLLDNLYIKPLSLDFKINFEKILLAFKKLNEETLIYRKTGGTHAAALFNELAELIYLAEDVGRHNAIDKVIGKAAINNLNFEKVFLATTGRQTIEMILKAIRVRVPIVASISAPTEKSIEIADKYGLTLICFVRGNRFNIYTHDERILF